MFLAHRRQFTKGLGVFGLELDAGAVGVFQRGRQSRAGLSRDSIPHQSKGLRPPALG